MSSNENDTCVFCTFDSFIEDIMQIADAFESFRESNSFGEELFPAMDDFEDGIRFIERAGRKVTQARGLILFRTPDGYKYLTPEQLSEYDNDRLN